jgi:adenosylcobinamide kinase/adenosylcobinamide-phosphate guanylyltransferase
MTLPKLTLVLGGAASGKSAFAEQLVMSQDDHPTYIATAQVFDDEMAKKVACHREMRGGNWQTIEEPLDIASAIAKSPAGKPILIDCATLWLTNVILGEHDLKQHVRLFLEAVTTATAPIVIVSNEVGQGIVPDNALSRQFRNAQGRLNQNVAAQADLVVAVMAGLPIALKGTLA